MDIASIDKSQYTPMVQQYLAVKEKHQNELLFYRLGDFYEMFFDDAITASRELNLTLTKRAGGAEYMPMCGVPYHSVEGYLAKLVRKGYRIAICEQVEDPKLAKGIVERKVIKIITPGTALNAELLEDEAHRFLAVLLANGDEACLAVSDVTTGECSWFKAVGSEAMGQIAEQLYRLAPAELVVFDSFVVLRIFLIEDSLSLTSLIQFSHPFLLSSFLLHRIHHLEQ